MHTIPLQGCTLTPLISYLKSLGILRVLSERFGEKSPSCRWENGTFVLQTHLNSKELVKFFLNDYKPTPLVSPWNGGSGFYFQEGKTKEIGSDGKKLKTGIWNQATEATRSVTTIEESTGARFADYRSMISQTKKLLLLAGRDNAPTDTEKKALVNSIRNSFPDRLIDWLDAAFVISGEDLIPPPLLLSGGNEGNLEFSNTFIQGLLSVIDANTDLPIGQSEAWLQNTLFGIPVKMKRDSSSGYFAPSIRGGANSTTGFNSKSYSNPWDFILAIEGIVILTGNAAKKLVNNRIETSFPFCVRASPGGYASGQNEESQQSKGEIWLPTWRTFTKYKELQFVFSEGRASLDKRQVRSGVDFARAVVSLGVDRGLNSFIRYGILPRFGDSYFASPLQEISVRRDSVIADLLALSDDWISRFFRETKADGTPSSLRRAARRLEVAIFAQSSTAQAKDIHVAQELLLSLAACEHALSVCNKKWLDDSGLNPLPPLARRWVSAVNDGTAEYRLAAALASVSVLSQNEFFPVRRQLEAVRVYPGEKARVEWDDAARRDVVWSEGPLVNVLCAMMKRRLLLAGASDHGKWREMATLTAWPSDVADFIEGRVDEGRLGELLWGLSLVNYSGHADPDDFPHPPVDRNRRDAPPAFYAQLKICFAGLPLNGNRVPIEPNIFNLAASGNGERASRQALRRLHGSSIPIMQIEIQLGGEAARRCAAALVFPLWEAQFAEVCSTIAPDLFNQPSQQ